MTLTDFKVALNLTRLSVDGRATLGALLVLVDGLTLENARQEAKCSRQAVAAAVLTLTHAAGRCPACGARVKGRSGRRPSSP